MSGVVRPLGPPQTALARLGNDRQSPSGRIVYKLAASGRIFALLLRMHGRICAVAGGPRAPILTGTEALFRDVVELSSRPPLWGNCGGDHLSVKLVSLGRVPTILRPGIGERRAHASPLKGQVTIGIIHLSLTVLELL